MPQYQVDGSVVEIARNSLLLDTSVLVAAFYDREEDERRETAQFLLQEDSFSLLVPTVVVVEAWGSIVGSKKDFRGGYELLGWLTNPGQVTVVPPHKASMESTHHLVKLMEIDVVDAMVTELAEDISESCDLQPELGVATFDARDFLKLKRRYYDMRSLDYVEFDR